MSSCSDFKGNICLRNWIVSSELDPGCGRWEVEVEGVSTGCKEDGEGFSDEFDSFLVVITRLGWV